MYTDLRVLVYIKIYGNTIVHVAKMHLSECDMHTYIYVLQMAKKHETAVQMPSDVRSFASSFGGESGTFARPNLACSEAPRFAERYENVTLAKHGVHTSRCSSVKHSIGCPYWVRCSMMRRK